MFRRVSKFNVVDSIYIRGASLVLRGSLLAASPPWRLDRAWSDLAVPARGGFGRDGERAVRWSGLSARVGPRLRGYRGGSASPYWLMATTFAGVLRYPWLIGRWGWSYTATSIWRARPVCRWGQACLAGWFPMGPAGPVISGLAKYLVVSVRSCFCKYL